MKSCNTSHSSQLQSIVSDESQIICGLYDKFHFYDSTGAQHNIVCNITNFNYGLHLEGSVHPKPLRLLHQHKVMRWPVYHLPKAELGSY